MRTLIFSNLGESKTANLKREFRSNQPAQAANIHLFLFLILIFRWFKWGTDKQGPSAKGDTKNGKQKWMIVNVHFSSQDNSASLLVCLFIKYQAYFQMQTLIFTNRSESQATHGMNKPLTLFKIIHFFFFLLFSLLITMTLGDSSQSCSGQHFVQADPALDPSEVNKIVCNQVNIVWNALGALDSWLIQHAVGLLSRFCVCAYSEADILFNEERKCSKYFKDLKAALWIRSFFKKMQSAVIHSLMPCIMIMIVIRDVPKAGMKSWQGAEIRMNQASTLPGLLCLLSSTFLYHPNSKRVRAECLLHSFVVVAPNSFVPRGTSESLWVSYIGL